MQNYYAKAIHMKYGCASSNDLLEIDSIRLNDNKWYTKAAIHDYVKKYPGSITVGTFYGPKLIPCISSNYEKYVKSTPNNSQRDNLLALPRE